MTVRTFWTIVIKILGLWLVVDCVTVITQLLTALSFLTANNTDNYTGLGVSIALLLLPIVLYIFILLLFVFKTAWLIDKLHLDIGFIEEKIELNIQLSTVLTIATIVIGGLMLVDSLPQLCKKTFMFLQEQKMFKESPNSAWIIFYLAKSIIGYLLMTNSRFVVGFIVKQKIKENDTNV